MEHCCNSNFHAEWKSSAKSVNIHRLRKSAIYWEVHVFFEIWSTAEQANLSIV